MPINILLVEDNEIDIRLMREIMREINPTARVHIVTDGAEAMEFLRYQGHILIHLAQTSSCCTLNLHKSTWP